MPEGGGKYAHIVERAAKMAGLKAERGGGVMVIVIGGNKGTGFGIQADLMTTMLVPDLLEKVAKEIRRDMEGFVKH